MPPSIGAISKLAIGAVGTGVASYTNMYEFISCQLAKAGNTVEHTGIRGTRSRQSARTRVGPYTAGGQLVMQPSKIEMDRIMPYIMGTAGTPHTLAETLPEFDVLVDKVIRRYVYGSCKFVRTEFTASEGSPLQVALQVEARTETEFSTSFPNIVEDRNPPWMFSDLTLRIDGTAYQCKEIGITIENVAELDRFMNTTSRTEIPIIDRVVSIRALVPWTLTEEPLYDMGVPHHTVIADFLNTNNSEQMTCTFPAVNFPAIGPTIASKGEFMLELSGIAREKSDGSKEVSILITS